MYEQAKRNFINAKLRDESGATISPSEFENADLQYFPQRGDSEEVVAQKRRGRQVVIEGMKTSAGGAYDELQSNLPKTTTFNNRQYREGDRITNASGETGTLRFDENGNPFVETD